MKVDEMELFRNKIDKMKHTIGLKDRNIRGIKHRKYEMYRNFYSVFARELLLDELVSEGYMNVREDNLSEGYVYWMTDKGIEFLSKITGVQIIKEDNTNEN